MSKYTKRIVLICFAIMAVIGLAVVVTPVFAANSNCVETSILGNGKKVCDDGKGSSVMHILRLVLDIMSMGVGFLGVVGIIVMGVQYLTAGGSEEKATKAKRRLFEIVIGLAAYAVLFGILTWLLPEYNSDNTSGNASGDTSVDGGGANNASDPSQPSGGSVADQNSGGGNNSSGDQATERNTFKKTEKGNWVYLDENGQKVTGEKKINGDTYYFNKNGVMQTGWVTIKNKKTGKEKRYYHKSNGKRAYGAIKLKSSYNQYGGKDTWYLDEKTGALEGVDLAVPRIAQTDGESCGSTSVLMVRAYLIGKQSYTYNGGTYAWNTPVPWRYVCGVGEIFPSCLEKFGYGRHAGGEYVKESALKQLYAGKPFIFRWYGQNAVDYGYAGGLGGHFMVISGYHNGTYTIKDPAGGSTPRKTSITSKLFEQYWHTGKLTFYYLYKLK